MSASPSVPRVLCQPGTGPSCGACCGMYNRPDCSEEATRDRLRRRTLAFRRDADVRDTASLSAFRRRHEAAATDKLLTDLPNCPFLGYLDVRGEDDVGHRVGCLVHPSRNDGIDGRDCGVYDRHTCEDYLCAAHDLMRPVEKWLIVEAIEDSYVYGLVVTDVRFVRELFERTADLNAETPTFGKLDQPGALRAARRYFRLKADWPFRDRDGIFGQLHAGEDLETPRRTGPAEALGVPPDRWETALRCLGTRVESVSELEAARDHVASRVHEFAEAVAG